MEKFGADGIVIRTIVTGESDLILSVLTRDRGVVRAFARGARGMKSKLHAGSAQFAYCDFMFYEKNGVFHVTDAAVKNLFYELRTDLTAISLAQYLCEVLLKNVPEGDTDPEYLRLLLGALHFLCGGKKPALLVKSVFELRFAALAGYAPDLTACAACGEFRSDPMVFNALTGELFCFSCGRAHNAPQVPYSVVCAMRHILYSTFEKIFSFTLKDELLPVLNTMTEKYLQNALQQKFRLLEFFWQYTQ